MSAPTSRTSAAIGLATVLVVSLTAFVTRHDAAPSAQEKPFPVEYYRTPYASEAVGEDAAS